MSDYTDKKPEQPSKPKDPPPPVRVPDDTTVKKKIEMPDHKVRS